MNKEDSHMRSPRSIRDQITQNLLGNNLILYLCAFDVQWGKDRNQGRLLNISLEKQGCPWWEVGKVWRMDLKNSISANTWFSSHFFPAKSWNDNYQSICSVLNSFSNNSLSHFGVLEKRVKFSTDRIRLKCQFLHHLAVWIRETISLILYFFIWEINSLSLLTS